MGSVEFDAGGPWSATRGAKTLHGDTAKLPRGTKKCHAGVFFVSPSRAINACEHGIYHLSETTGETTRKGCFKI